MTTPSIAGVEHGLRKTSSRADGGWEAHCLCGKVVETPNGTRRHAEIALANHIATLRIWAEVAEEVSSGVYSQPQALERYGLEQAAPSLRSDVSAMDVTARARTRIAAYRAFLDRMLDKDTRDILQVMEDYIESEGYAGPAETDRSAGNRRRSAE